MTLNYEHKRLKLRVLEGDELIRKKADSALKNYKLKVSRLLTCFSMVANLAAQPAAVSPEDVLSLCAETPRERLRRLAPLGRVPADLVTALDERYEVFLEAVQRPEADVLAEFEAADRRTRALVDASEFGDLIYELIKATAYEPRMRYLLI